MATPSYPKSSTGATAGSSARDFRNSRYPDIRVSLQRISDLARRSSDASSMDGRNNTSGTLRRYGGVGGVGMGGGGHVAILGTTTTSTATEDPDVGLQLPPAPGSSSGGGAETDRTGEKTSTFGYS